MESTSWGVGRLRAPRRAPLTMTVEQAEASLQLLYELVSDSSEKLQEKAVIA